MLGKQKCKILKEIRQRIADENDIPYVTRECSYQGECSGTCPRCEAELRYLEQQLALRASLGKRIAVAALCAGMSLGAAGCTPLGQKPDTDVIEELTGEVEPSTQTEEPDIYVLTGEVDDEEPEELELAGDVALDIEPESEANG